MATANIRIRLTLSDSLEVAIAQFRRVKSAAPETAQRFLDGLQSFDELVLVQTRKGSAAGAGELAVVANPSELFLGFLAANRTGY